jgi:hypothetical protein
METEIIENKVAKSGLVTIDLQQFEPKRQILSFDLKEYLYMELILKEKDFREALDKHSWQDYQKKILAVYCSTDAIIARWAYMLVATHAVQAGAEVHYGTPSEVHEMIMLQRIRNHDWQQYEGKRVLLKGCSDREISPSVYLEATSMALPVVNRLMYGEACSFVPIYKKPANAGKS